MTTRFAFLVLLAASISCAWAQEQAFTNRSTELKDRGAVEAKTLASLPENTSVKVLARNGGWTRVEAGGQAGFVRVFHLRFPAAIESGASQSTGGGFLSGLTSAIGGGKPATRSTTIATTGIRGLSPEDLKSASPDAEALRKAASYRADKPAAERFAKDGRLTPVTVDYSEGERR